MLAQAAAAPELLTELARTGLLGLLLVIALYALFRRDRDLTEERKGRLDDAKGLRAMVEADTAARVEATKSMDERNRLMEQMAKLQVEQYDDMERHVTAAAEKATNMVLAELHKKTP